MCEINEGTLSLSDLNLNPNAKNQFEIHEKEGPPKRIKIDDFNESSSNFIGPKNSILNDTSDELMPKLESTHYSNEQIGTYPMRRNAHTDDLLMSAPSDFSTSFSFGSSYFNYEEEMKSEFVGLINQAMTCYLNSLLQTLYMTPEFRNAIYRWKYNESKSDDDDGKKNIPYQLQRLFLNLQTSKKKSIQTHDLTKSFGWNNDDGTAFKFQVHLTLKSNLIRLFVNIAFQQHDVQELSRVMFEALEKMFKGTEQENLISELYQGKIKDYVKCLEVFDCHR